MTPDQMNIFKTAIVEAVESHLVNGGKIISGHFRDKNNCRCPIGCLAYEEMVAGDHVFYKDALTVRLGFPVSNDEMWRFLDGFDNIINHNVGTEIYSIAQELRAKYLKDENA